MWKGEEAWGEHGQHSEHFQIAAIVEFCRQHSTEWDETNSFGDVKDRTYLPWPWIDMAQGASGNHQLPSVVSADNAEAERHRKLLQAWP